MLNLTIAKKLNILFKLMEKSLQSYKRLDKEFNGIKLNPTTLIENISIAF